jgi:hypothetical protein
MERVQNQPEDFGNALPPVTAQSAAPQRRNVAVLALAQALFMSVQAMGISATPLAAYMLLDADHKWLATVPIFLVHLGIMGTTIPASFLMAAIGRRAGFSFGALIGVGAGLVGCTALYQQSFPLMCVSAVLQGMQAAFFWYFRLAAADTSEPDFRAKAISLVMAGGVLAGFLGPQTAKWAVDWLAPVTFAGVYVAMAAFSVAVLVLIQYSSNSGSNGTVGTPCSSQDQCQSGYVCVVRNDMMLIRNHYKVLDNCVSSSRDTFRQFVSIDFRHVVHKPRRLRELSTEFIVAAANKPENI